MDTNAEIIDLKRRVAALEGMGAQMQALQRLLLDIPKAVGAYSASSPTADGTVPMQINGQRFNVLVDKV